MPFIKESINEKYWNGTTVGNLQRNQTLGGNLWTMKRNPVVEESSMGSFGSKLQCLGTRQFFFGFLYPMLKMTGIFQCKARKMSVLTVSAFYSRQTWYSASNVGDNRFLGYARPTQHNVIIMQLQKNTREPNSSQIPANLYLSNGILHLLKVEAITKEMK